MFKRKSLFYFEWGKIPRNTAFGLNVIMMGIIKSQENNLALWKLLKGSFNGRPDRIWAFQKLYEIRYWEVMRSELDFIYFFTLIYYNLFL